MADDFGLKIGLEGEKEFKKALSDINQSFKVLGSEMKVVSSQFDKNDESVEALTARNQVLSKEIDTQKQKIETLNAALKNASESFGENDRRTQNWQIQLNNATAALNDMERELSANNDALTMQKVPCRTWQTKWTTLLKTPTIWEIKSTLPGRRRTNPAVTLKNSAAY